MKSALIVEDEPGLQITLKDRLKAEGYEVTIRGDGLEGEFEALKNICDIILLDIMLPFRDGYAVCSNIRKAGIETPVLMLTARNTNLDTVIGLRQGTDDYLAKLFDMSVLLAGIEALLRRYSRSSSSNLGHVIQIRFGEFILDNKKGSLFKGSMEIGLNTQEFRLLNYLASNSNTVISRNTLLNMVYTART